MAESGLNSRYWVSVFRFCLYLFAATAVLHAQSRHDATARATGNLDAIARTAAHRVAEPSAAPREIEEPERALRRRNGAARATRNVRPSIAIAPAPATVTPS